MQKSYHRVYKYLILYIVLSFIDNNKYFINCQKIKRDKMKLYEESSHVNVLCQNGGRIPNVTDLLSTYCNYTALAQKSEFDDDNNSRKFKYFLFFFIFPSLPPPVIFYKNYR